eukprot:TRINITY_DN80452_c0_g1_i1.p1 TRINITY_DN80452_c0_g1~~TRINITY_DN80452_c0_g1_i1.p1  ORF type:complete len:756 (+),score=232.81 TRINITY_DN80452_c0_g1_i1:110-2377(+)
MRPACPLLASVVLLCLQAYLSSAARLSAESDESASSAEASSISRSGSGANLQVGGRGEKAGGDEKPDEGNVVIHVEVGSPKDAKEKEEEKEKDKKADHDKKLQDAMALLQEMEASNKEEVTRHLAAIKEERAKRRKAEARLKERLTKLKAEEPQKQQASRTSEQGDVHSMEGTSSGSSGSSNIGNSRALLQESESVSSASAQVGVFFDCAADYDNYQMAWSEDKKNWCCDHERKGCRGAPGPPGPVGPVAVPAPVVAPPLLPHVEAPQLVQQTQPIVVEVPREPPREVLKEVPAAPTKETLLADLAKQLAPLLVSNSAPKDQLEILQGLLGGTGRAPASPAALSPYVAAAGNPSEPAADLLVAALGGGGLKLPPHSWAETAAAASAVEAAGLVPLAGRGRRRLARRRLVGLRNERAAYRAMAAALASQAVGADRDNVVLLRRPGCRRHKRGRIRRAAAFDFPEAADDYEYGADYDYDGYWVPKPPHSEAPHVFNCSEDAEHWLIGWSAAKKAYCMGAKVPPEPLEFAEDSSEADIREADDADGVVLGHHPRSSLSAKPRLPAQKEEVPEEEEAEEEISSSRHFSPSLSRRSAADLRDRDAASPRALAAREQSLDNDDALPPAGTADDDYDASDPETRKANNENVMQLVTEDEDDGEDAVQPGKPGLKLPCGNWKRQGRCETALEEMKVACPGVCKSDSKEEEEDDDSPALSNLEKSAAEASPARAADDERLEQEAAKEKRLKALLDAVKKSLSAM